MELRSGEYWNKRYEDGEIGWDLGKPSTPLATYLDQVDKDISLLVPAGGNNYDAEYAHALGIKDVHVIDVSPIALDSFAQRCPSFPKENIHIGDFFDHEGQYDLILEQTFFCAINHDLRQSYADKMHSLLNDGGTLAGLWFDFPFTKATDNPPLGGSLEEYLGYFEPYFNIKTFERCYNSAEEKRQGKELFGIMKKEIMNQYDVIIIGGGPVGLMCAIECKKRNLTHLILEKGVLVNSIYNFPSNMTFFSTSKKLEIGEVPFISHTDKPTRREALEYYRRVYDSWDLNAKFYHPVDSFNKTDNGFEITAKGQVYQSKAAIVCTGFYGIPKLMNIPGENLDKVFHYYTEVHPFIDQKVVVIGSANSACDVAMELYHKGADVTMVIRQPEISERVKYWIKPNIENRIKEGSIKAYFSSTVDKINPKTIEVTTPDGQLKLENDFVLAMTGYRPDFSFLEELGIKFTDDEVHQPIHNEATLETNVDGLYVAGVIMAGNHTSKVFIENSMEHALKISNHIQSSIA